jgi:hypothetical protein
MRELRDEEWATAVSDGECIPDDVGQREDRR